LSRPLVALACLAFAVVGLLPLAVMFARITGADLADLMDARTLSLLARTLKLGGLTALFALCLGLPFGFLVARTDVPGAALLRPLGVVPLLMPPLMMAMTWAVIWEGLRGAPATIAMLTLSTFPLVSIFTARAFERIDGGAEDAARLLGGLRSVLRMELPLVLPASLTGACLAFVFAINDFGVPDYVSSIGVKFNVYADEIKLNWDQFQRPGKAVATALPLMLVTLAALTPALALRRRGAMASLSAGFRQPSTLRLGVWRWPAFVFAAGLVTAAVLVPIGRLLWEAAAMPRHLQAQGSSFVTALADGARTLHGEFGQALELARADLGRSLLYATAAAALCVPIGLILGHAIERARRPLVARGIELLALLPLAAPALLFGIGIIATWNHDLTARLYDSGAMAVILFVGRYATFPILIGSGAVASLSPVFEEAGALAGAGPARRLLRIVAPSLRGSLCAGFVLVFVFAMRDLDSAILVPAANKTAIFRVFNGVHFGRDSYVASLALLLLFAILLPGLLWSFFARKRLEVLP
jgi:iron(III) transport system permease protein